MVGKKTGTFYGQNHVRPDWRSTFQLRIRSLHRIADDLAKFGIELVRANNDEASSTSTAMRTC
jgi:hypothetical protein